MDNRGQGGAEAGADPLTRQVLREMAARTARAGPLEGPGGGAKEQESDGGCGCGPDAAGTLRLLAAWHRRGTEVGFPELTAVPHPAAGRS
ncbi:hypothetical protein ABZX90_42900 [Streptomyces sp. NPDC002935]|uniref:hypothetical protein n=1 Tax=unclassified Streptomyces TaxID=2593676 RepID=UPI0033298A5E